MSLYLSLVFVVSQRSVKRIRPREHSTDERRGESVSDFMPRRHFVVIHDSGQGSGRIRWKPVGVREITAILGDDLSSQLVIL